MSRIEMDENVMLTLITAMILAAIVVTACYCTSTTMKNRRDMAVAGYEQVTVPGTSNVVWQKVKP